MILEDGTGSGRKAKVDSQYRLRTHSVTESEALHGTEEGRGYNVNTGLMTITGNATLLYIKNTGDNDIVIDAAIVGSLTGTVVYTSDPYITITRNPTGGDLISDATAVAINQNRNFGSTETLNALAYKGKVGGTVTGGDTFGIFQLNANNRNFFPVELILKKGTGLAASLTLNGTGTANFYIAVNCYVKKDTTD